MPKATEQSVSFKSFFFLQCVCVCVFVVQSRVSRSVNREFFLPPSGSSMKTLMVLVQRGLSPVKQHHFNQSWLL